ncbi:3-phosphoshikimate 1-carboxyvinyltransferase [Maricaulis sp. CAU 1757]
MIETPSSPSGPLRARPGAALSGRLAAPGDKSVSHRAFILAGLARGTSRITGLLEGEDVKRTGAAMAALGARIERTGPGAWSVTGTGGALVNPSAPLDFGNAGTGVRLVMGAAAGAGIAARFIGDESLSARPMRRVTDPLTTMGARLDTCDGRLPVDLAASSLTGIDYTPPVASAQVKSALLLAGLGAVGTTRIHEPIATRDHTETMLALFGAPLQVERSGTSLTASLDGPLQLSACDIAVPGDPSSAAFAIVATLVCPGSRVSLTGMMDNPARTGLLTTLREMGARIEARPGPRMAGEATLDLDITAGPLTAIDVPAERAASMIDEYPVLAVAAAFANGTTHLAGLAELKAKESDRLTGTADLLAANGVRVETGEDSLTIHGCGPTGVPGGGRVETRHDHRLAMSALVLGLASQQPVEIDDGAMIATSYPGFLADMTGLGARLEPVS